ncbi:MAG: class I SAM-dependent methyltransferase [Candidatus Aenigmarchaeota archaeon]|nr:class I SAM-dependent methyltransferase [Candidatus Aenigmarchaeota archaeon]
MNQRHVWNVLASPWKAYRRRVWPETKQFLGSRSGLILDLGCGSGRNFERVNGKIVGLDFSENMLKFAKQCKKERNIDAGLVCGNLTSLPFEDETFDAAIYISTLQCIEGKQNRKKALKELHRVLRKNSELLLTCWNRDQPRFRGKREDSIPWSVEGKKLMRYYYLFGQKELQKLLESAGFEIMELHGSEAKAFNLFSKNIIALVRKK